MSLDRRLLRLEQRLGSAATGPYTPESKPSFDFEGFRHIWTEVWAQNTGAGWEEDDHEPA